MKTLGTTIGLIVLSLASLGCSENRTVSLWDRHCAVCHDGQTVLNEKVVMSREEMILKFKDRALDNFVDACEGSSSCMNILKHQEKLLRSVGKEMGIGDSSGK